MKDCIKKLLFKTEEVASIGIKYAPTVNEASFQSLKIFVHVFEKIEFNFGTRYSWEKTNNFNPKITAKQLVINILRTFRPSTGAIFNANNVPQTGWLVTTPY